MEMYEKDYREWLEQSGYTDINDWNYQTIGRSNYFFIKHLRDEKYALIKHTPVKQGLWIPSTYEVLLQGWTDYNGWNET